MPPFCHYIGTNSKTVCNFQILSRGGESLIVLNFSGKGVESEHRVQRFERCSILFIPPWHNLQIETLGK